MNTEHLQMISNNYFARFEKLNGPVHMEYYKWQIIQRFRAMMDEVFDAPDKEFTAKLYAVKKLRLNMIDSYTQSLSALVEYAQREPDAVGLMSSKNCNNFSIPRRAKHIVEKLEQLLPLCERLK